MLLKISGEIEGDWSMKKKVQMGWKITKNMIHKALDAGIKPPKIEKGDYSVMKSAAYRGDNIWEMIVQLFSGSYSSSYSSSSLLGIL